MNPRYLWISIKTVEELSSASLRPNQLIIFSEHHVMISSLSGSDRSELMQWWRAAITSRASDFAAKPLGGACAHMTSTKFQTSGTSPFHAKLIWHTLAFVQFLLILPLNANVTCTAPHAPSLPCPARALSPPPLFFSLSSELWSSFPSSLSNEVIAGSGVSQSVKWPPNGRNGSGGQAIRDCRMSKVKILD